ncbi:MAG: Fe-S-binding domain-containing protein, partial [Chloroflexota bacterium]|nr:Fe-S-binding domain-containing protein [Chloroflexota bacterium]
LYEAAPLPARAFTTMLVKVGAYGFMRIVLPVLPDASATLAPLMAGLSIAGIIYGGALAATAPNLVRALAYSSIAHLGFIGLGIWSLRDQGVQGAVLQMVNHGITAAALFLLAAYLLRRTGTLEFARLGGLAGRWPVLTWLVLLATLSALGLPGLNNFVGEFLVVLDAYRAEPIYAVALVGVLLAAVYGIRYFQLLFYGPARAEEPERARDLRPAELWPLVPVVVLIVLIGLYPRPVLSTADSVARQIVARPAAVEQAAVPRPWGFLWNR